MTDDLTESLAAAPPKKRRAAASKPKARPRVHKTAALLAIAIVISLANLLLFWQLGGALIR